MTSTEPLITTARFPHDERVVAKNGRLSGDHRRKRVTAHGTLRQDGLSRDHNVGKEAYVAHYPARIALHGICISHNVKTQNTAPDRAELKQRRREEQMSKD